MEGSLIINQDSLLMASPIKDMLTHKVQGTPTSYGLTECGYDIRIKQEVRFKGHQYSGNYYHHVDGVEKPGWFALASSIEEFDMPDNLMGQVLNKSTWARLCLDASMTTNIEPGWQGFLTLELTYHGQKDLIIPAGSGIAQVMFHEIAHPVRYTGKYQHQADEPVEAKHG